MKKVVLFTGLLTALLGGLWLLQGLGIVHMRPILCLVDCDPVQGPSAKWAVIGAVMIMAGSAFALWSLKWRSQ